MSTGLIKENYKRQRLLVIEGVCHVQGHDPLGGDKSCITRASAVPDSFSMFLCKAFSHSTDSQPNYLRDSHGQFILKINQIRSNDSL